ncbi:MAG: TVP38/TMEM64 family protein [Pyrinomonadaceae bacterium]
MIRRTAIAIWAVLITASILSYLIWPHHFSPDNIASTLRTFENEALLVYLVISTFRGFTLLPSTPLILAGSILFPHRPFLVLAVSIFGILASSSMIYWFSEFLGLSGHFEARKGEAVKRIRTRLERPGGIIFVAVWAFFPLVPTDAVCYVAGSIRMNFPKFIGAIFIGELLLCVLYVFAGNYFLT